jgi:hypothetical protein
MAQRRKIVSGRAIAGLIVPLSLSFVNLIGAFLILSSFGGVEPWSDTQFIGLFGVIETGIGLSFLISPNLWRLPVAEANTSPRSAVRLAPSIIFAPHWAALAKAFAGLLMILYAAFEEGIGLNTLGLPFAVLFIALAFVSLSLIVARLGVARPDLDVVFLTARRPGHEELALPGISIGGVILQVLSNFGIVPAVKLLTPSALYNPEFGQSLGLLLVTAVCGLAPLMVAWLVWRDRLATKPPAEQRREAEAEYTINT